QEGAIDGLVLVYEQLETTYERVRAFRTQRRALEERLRTRSEETRAGRATLDALLEAQRFWSDALVSEQQAVAQYNTALARCASVPQRAKGARWGGRLVVPGEGGGPSTGRETIGGPLPPETLPSVVPALLPLARPLPER